MKIPNLRLNNERKKVTVYCRELSYTRHFLPLVKTKVQLTL